MKLAALRCDGCWPVGHGDLPLRVLRGVSAMRETCLAIGAGAELECSINDFVIEAGVARSPPDVHAARLATPVVPVTPVREGILQLEQALSPCTSAARLEGVRVAWRVTGNPRRAAGRSARRHFRGPRRGGHRHQPEGLVVRGDRSGQGARYASAIRCSASTSSAAAARPPGRVPARPIFPRSAATTRQRSCVELLEHLHAAPLAAIIGASYGGMVALAFAERYPQLVKHAIAISAADRAHPMATAWRSVQRAMVRYATRNGDAPEGLRLARALAMATYRSPEEFAARFSGAAVADRWSLSVSRSKRTCSRAAMPTRPRTCRKRSCACPSPSTCTRRCGAHPRPGDAGRNSSKISSSPSPDLRSLEARLGGEASLVELSSLYGHDAFLKEGAALEPVFARAL